MRNEFVEELTRLAAEDERIMLLTGDLGFMVLEPFREQFPERFVNCGVAEQNMVGMATGLAQAGYVPFVSRSRPSRRCVPTSSFATAPCCTNCRCASWAWAVDSTTATTASRTSRWRTTR